VTKGLVTETPKGMTSVVFVENREFGKMEHLDFTVKVKNVNCEGAPFYKYFRLSTAIGEKAYQHGELIRACGASAGRWVGERSGEADAGCGVRWGS
jgi:hypothetical protein